MSFFSKKKEPAATNAEETDADTEVLGEEPKSILLGIISQLKPGNDLSRVTLPTFILEPRSFLERLTDFYSHPMLLMDLCDIPDPLERFIGVVRWYLSGWHLRPQGVKKPYNPILGESFRAEWDLGPYGRMYYIAEQVSHHPPIAAFHSCCRKRNIVTQGSIHPKSKFLLNSAASIMEGTSSLFILNHEEEYKINLPSYYARGILVGALHMELCGNVEISCAQSGFIAELEFKSKGIFRGESNAVAGKIKMQGVKDTLFNIQGSWDNQLTITDTRTKEKSVLFDVKTADIIPKTVASDEEQGPFESRRLWNRVTKAIRAKDLDTATQHKMELEDRQREGSKTRKDRNVAWKPKYFHQVGEQWKFKGLNLTKYKGADDPEEEHFGEAWKAATTDPDPETIPFTSLLDTS